MKVSGSAALNAPPSRVWAALNDPSVLARTIPGCEQLEAVGTDRYRMLVTAGVASIKGTYLGSVTLSHHEPPFAFTLTASGAGAPGTVDAQVRVTLSDQGDGTTLVGYDADAVIGGAVGGVGQRVLSGVAKRTAAQFFRAVDAALGDAPPAGTDSVPEQAQPPELEAADNAPSAAEVADVVRAGSPPGTDALGIVFPGSQLRPAGPLGLVPGEVRNQLAGALVGAVIALIGVVIGWSLGRHSGASGR